MKLGQKLILLLLSSCCLATSAQAQQLGGGQTSDISLWRVFGALACCLLLAVGAAFALRYRMTGTVGSIWTAAATARRMTLIERMRLGPQADLCIVAIDGAEWLVTVTNTQVHLLPYAGSPQPNTDQE